MPLSPRWRGCAGSRRSARCRPIMTIRVYIDALAESLLAGLARLDFEPEIVLASFHGLPRAYLDKGDPVSLPVPEDGAAAARARSAGRRTGSASSSSRASARAEWLQPYTDVTIAELAKSGIKRLAVIMPGFSADCLETLEEIAIRGRRDVSRERRRRTSPRSPASTTARGHAADRARSSGGSWRAGCETLSFTSSDDESAR